MDSFRDIIAVFPRRRDLADALGVELDRVHTWHRRDSIPGEMDVALVAALAERGIALSYERLAQLRARPEPRRMAS